MLCLCKKSGNGLPGLNHAAFCNPDFTCVKRPDAENLAQRFHAFNMVQENNMGWNIMIRQKLHMTDSNFTQLIIQILHFLTKFSQFHCFPRFKLSLFHCYTLTALFPWCVVSLYCLLSGGKYKRGLKQLLAREGRGRELELFPKFNEWGMGLIICRLKNSSTTNSSICIHIKLVYMKITSYSVIRSNEIYFMSSNDSTFHQS